MKPIIKTEEKAEKSWISTTGYRILLILKSLIESSKTIDELVTIVKNNPITSKSASKDTIRIAINTLKTTGCIITRPSKANKYKYELIKHPFVLSVSDDELKNIVNLREKFAKNINLNDILTLNDLYSKIGMLTFDEEKINYIENSQPLKTIDKKILYELSKPEIINKKVQVCYKSPEFGEEKIYIVPKKIIYDNEKVYLWCYNFKYEGLGLLNIERILKINSIDILKNINIFNHYNVVYELTGEAVNSFEPKDYETILVKSDDKIKVNAKIENEFLFIQRLLQFGTDFKVISPDFFREILINKIKLIQKGYIND